MTRYTFLYNERLDIDLPHLSDEWDAYSHEDRAEIVARWEHIRGAIPDKIKKLEQQINIKQAKLNEEENFALSCELNSQIADLASRINDLYVWFRINQQVDVGKTHM